MSRPEPPAELDDLAKKEWCRVAHLRSIRLGELTLLEAYCRSWSKWQQAEARLAVEGPTLLQPMPKGRFKVVANPLTVVAARYERRMLSAARQLKLNRENEESIGAEVNPFLALLEEDD